MGEKIPIVEIKWVEIDPYFEPIDGNIFPPMSDIFNGFRTGKMMEKVLLHKITFNFHTQEGHLRYLFQVQI